jgi:hypothetical protein
MNEKTKYENIVAIDIETSSKGEVLDIGCYTYNDYIVFRNWKQFFEHLITIQNDCRVIAHNGFGFDFITFNQWFLKNRLKYGISDDDITYLSSESLLIAVIIRYQGRQYTLLDTMRFFPGQSLQKLAESFLGESKDDVPDDYISRMEDYKRKFRNKYYQYLRRDCEILYNVYDKFREEINSFTDIGELGMSAGSTALKSFRRWLHTDYPRTRIFSAPTEYIELANYALRGGLTLYIGDGKHTQHKYENVHHYDVISMYPSVMRYVPVPCSPMIYTDKVLYDLDCIRPGWYLTEYKQTKGRVPILFPIDSELPQWEGQGVLSHFDLQFLDLFGEYKVIDGVCYEDYIFPFEGYFDDLLDLRMTAKKEKKTAKAHALKILANALYGKFGQKHTREIIMITSDRDWYESYIEAQLRDYKDTGITEYVVTDDYVVYGVESSGTSFSNRFVGSMVTSLARIKLGVILNTVHSIYCDTDSVFTQDTLPECFIGNQPGDFEESETSPNEMICLGKKSYQYGEGIKFKGIPSKRLTTEDMNQMRFDIEKEVEYASPTAWKTAMKNQVKNPNQFLPKTRTVRRGKSFAETGLLRPDGKLFKVDVAKNFLEYLLSL